MKPELYINEANDYARDIGAPIWHPHVAIIHYDEMGEIRHTLNRGNVYGVFVQDNFPDNLTYGIGTYHQGEGSLMAYAPGQIGGKKDDGTRRQYYGWVLLFDPVFVQNTPLGQQMSDYHFFSYGTNEALILTTEEKQLLWALMASIRDELRQGNEVVEQDNIIRDYIHLILDYCKRFYVRQFQTMRSEGNDILSRFEQLLIDYYAQGMQREHGLPRVKYCASKLCLSPSYFGDIIREAIGESPKDYIHDFVVRRAKELLLSGLNVAQVSEQLGFEYPNHFTRFFKQATGQTPSQFYTEMSQK